MNLPKIEAVLYDLEIPSQKKTIKVKQLRAKDEKILLTAKESTGTPEEKNLEMLNAIKQVINNAIVTPGIDVNKLAIFDIEWAFIKLRALSVSNVIETAYHDNEEMQEWQNREVEPAKPSPLNFPQPDPYTFKINLDEVQIKWPDNISKSIEIPNSNVVIWLKYPDASLYTNKEFLQASGEKLVDYLIQNSLDQIENGSTRWKPSDVTLPELMEFLNELPIAVYDKIKNFLSNLPHVFYEIKYQNKMGHERTIVLDKLADFFQF